MVENHRKKNQWFSTIFVLVAILILILFCGIVFLPVKVAQLALEIK